MLKMSEPKLAENDTVNKIKNETEEIKGHEKSKPKKKAKLMPDREPLSEDKLYE